MLITWIDLIVWSLGEKVENLSFDNDLLAN